MNHVAIIPTRSPVTIKPCRPLFTIFNFLYGLASYLETWRQSHKARMQFSRIEARTLRDVGISEAQRFILSEL